MKANKIRLHKIKPETKKLFKIPLELFDVPQIILNHE